MKRGGFVILAFEADSLPDELQLDFEDRISGAKV